MKKTSYTVLRKKISRLAQYPNRISCDITGERDAKHILRLFPQFQHYEAFIKSDSSRIESAYQNYINQVSTEFMAVSFQTSLFLCAVARILKPKRLLDLGSGFSSFILRYIAATSDEPTEVSSVDDNESWLEKTSSFLSAQKVDCNLLVNWTDFRLHNTKKYDLIFQDMGTTDIRESAFSFVLNLLDEGGIIIFDDMHSPSYRSYVYRESTKAGLRLYSVRKFTLDRKERFSTVGLAR